MYYFLQSVKVFVGVSFKPWSKIEQILKTNNIFHTISYMAIKKIINEGTCNRKTQIFRQFLG